MAQSQLKTIYMSIAAVALVFLLITLMQQKSACSECDKKAEMYYQNAMDDEDPETYQLGHPELEGKDFEEQKNALNRTNVLTGEPDYINLLTPMDYPYTTTQSNGIPVNDIQAQKMFSLLPESDFQLAMYQIGGADEAIRLAQQSYLWRMQDFEGKDAWNAFNVKNSTVESQPGAIDDLRIVKQNNLRV